ncbi:MAG: SDR family oxidoreductase [Ktedonobacterales bacterium]|nr:SDR family oxidoreductase [Ktedonobacterales bacterium]
MTTWGVDDIPDLRGQTIIVTGANSGLGFATTSALAAHGASVVMAVRDPQKGTQALSRIQAQFPQATVEVARLDLASLASITQFAAHFMEHHAHLHVLINNAGVMALPPRQTADGFEMQFGTNHLGHFALTGALFPLLRQQPQARVVTLTSFLHRSGHIDFADLQGRQHYRPWVAYSQAKLANLLFAFELQRRVDAAGIPLLSMAAHPGYAATNLQAAGPQMEGNRFKRLGTQLGNALFAQSAADGALPTLYAATAPQSVGGGFYGPANFGGMRGAPTAVRGAPQAYAVDVAQRLWQVSEELTGMHYLDGAP